MVQTREIGNIRTPQASASWRFNFNLINRSSRFYAVSIAGARKINAVVFDSGLIFRAPTIETAQDAIGTCTRQKLNLHEAKALWCPKMSPAPIIPLAMNPEPLERGRWRAVFCFAIVVCLIAVTILATSSRAQVQKPLKEVFKNDFLIGAALNKRHFFEEDTRGAEIVRTHFNTITSENVLKWEQVHPQPDRYDFVAPDRFVSFGEKHQMFIVGHTLVWHNQTPSWVFQDEKGRAVDRETLLNRLREHIFTVVGRYRGKIKGWDVVNEALNQDGTMRQSPWLKIIGEDYLAKAFEFAQQADPSAELYYNDYDLELPAKRKGAVELIKKLKDKGVPIDAVGLQNHNLLYWPSIADEDATIDAFAKLGMKVHITELDVDVLPRTTKPGADFAVDIAPTPKLNPYTRGLPKPVQSAQARRYAELFRVYLKHRDAVERVTFWGVADRDSWLNNWPIKGRTNHPLLFDRAGQPKLALSAVIDTTVAAR